MARFQCEDCGGDDLKKPKLAGHFRSCAQPTGQETVQGHAQCISGAEKYGPPKGQNKASMEIFPSCAGNHLASAATSRQAEGEDRISPLPDNILLLILQELAARVEAIRTCSLSRRWRWLPWLLLEPRISVKKFIPSGVELWMVDKRALDRVAGRFCRAIWIELEDPRPLQGSFSKLTVLNLGDGQYELLWMIFFLQAAPFLQNFNLSIQKDMRSRHGRQQETPYCETTCSEFKHKHLKSLKIAGFKVEEKYMEFVRMVMELAMALQTIILTDEESCNYYRPTPTGSRYPKGDREKSSIVKQLMDGITSKVQIFIE
uniref:At1g61320/AtMIF1 LRR domain-containing protein n=1 Tax=Oryza rufipogon TaxID=4529 RepID=A0A0E0MYI6_ORYRU